MMSSRRRFLIFLFILLGLLLSAEVGARRYIRSAPAASFDRYASFDQLTARYGIAPLDLHRNIGYTGNVEYVRAEDFHNSFGYRGEEFEISKAEGAFRIVTLGGTSTYSEGVSDFRQSYPYLLSEYVRGQGYSEVEVINAGLPGYTSWESFLNFNFRVLDLQPDLVLFYPDIEDVAARLVWPPEAYLADNSGYLDNITAFTPPWWEGSTALRILLISLGLTTSHTDLAIQWRPRAQTSHELALLQQYAQESYPAGIFRETAAEDMLAANVPIYFRNNLRSMVASGRVHQVPFVFISALVHPRDLEDPAGYYAALQEHNSLVEGVAAENQLPYLDLAAVLPNDPEAFTDGGLLNAAGNQQLAEAIGDFLIENRLIRP